MGSRVFPRSVRPSSIESAHHALRGAIFRPPSEAESLILQATVGCSWNHCTYCAMYREKRYRVRPLDELIAEVRAAGRALRRRRSRGSSSPTATRSRMELSHWEPLLAACREAFPRLRRVSAYATALNVAAKSDAELRRLRELGLSLLYMGPETRRRRHVPADRQGGRLRGARRSRRGARTRPG